MGPSAGSARGLRPAGVSSRRAPGRADAVTGRTPRGHVHQGRRPPMSKADDALATLQRPETAGQVSPPAAANIRRWLTEPPFARYRDRLTQDIDAGKWQVLDDAFYAVLEFGTGGRRGKMYPVGTNVLNERTIAESARGLADHVTALKGSDAPRSCVIARDTRHNSPEFARLCARVLAAAGFKV